MAIKENERIETIQRGRIDFYMPLKFETSKDYAEICNCIEKAATKYFDGRMSEMRTDLQDSLAVLKDEMYIEKHGKLPIKRTCEKWLRDRRMNKKTHLAREKDGTVIELYPTEKGQMIEIHPGELLAYEDRCREMEVEYKQLKKIYGNKFVASQSRYILWPLQVRLNNGEHSWINSIIHIYENKMGVLKIELPLINVDAQPLKDYDYDTYIQGVDDKWGIVDVGFKPTIKSICSTYIQKIVNESGITIVTQDGWIKNIILLRYNGMPKQIQNIPNITQEDLFKIIAAPVPNAMGVSIKQKAREYIEKQSWDSNHVKYILSTTGGCLSVVDSELLDWVYTDYKEKNNVEAIDKSVVELIDKSITRDLCINVEFALIIPLLKVMNSAYVFEKKLTKPEDMYDAQMKYNLNLMFISGLQEFCYGSASEQLEAFERLMPYYLKNRIVAEKMHGIDRVLAEESRLRHEKLQLVLSLAGLVMALVFGLPAIHETIEMAREICTFICYDVPILTIDNTSMVVWFLLISLLGYNLFRMRKINKRKTMRF